MLSDEERKAIELLKQEPDFSLNYYNRENAIDVVLNLIEKQCKEIEELKDINKKLEARKYMLNAITGEVTEIPLDNNYIRKDKIKAKIEEVDIQLQKLKDGLTGRKTNFVNKNMLFAQKEVLQSLLEKE